MCSPHIHGLYNIDYPVTSCIVKTKCVDRINQVIIDVWMDRINLTNNENVS